MSCLETCNHRPQFVVIYTTV